MTDVREIEDATYERIKVLCAEGDERAAARKFDDAIEHYSEALDLVPDPKTDWNASTWILAAIGDACFWGGYRTSALEALQDAMWCPGAIGNPFLHLRLGQVLFDDGEDMDRVADELMRAYMGGGEEIFSDEDPHYLAFCGRRRFCRSYHKGRTKQRRCNRTPNFSPPFRNQIVQRLNRPLARIRRNHEGHLCWVWPPCRLAANQPNPRPGSDQQLHVSFV